MLQLYPTNAAQALEFDKITALIHGYCRTDSGKERAANMRLMSRAEIIEKALLQTSEYRQSLAGPALPNDFETNLKKEIRLLAVQGAVLTGENFLAVRRLAENTRDVKKWFDGREKIFPTLYALTEPVAYERAVADIINAVIDDQGAVKDNASRELQDIRRNITAKRGELRRMFDSILRKMQKQGYLADISEGYLNGRRTVAITAEHKRVVRGILHGESDTSRTVFIEPEETIELNNELFTLEREEGREVHRILAETTAKLSVWQLLIETWYKLNGMLDFIRGKAVLAQSMDAYMPRLSAHPGVDLIKAYHPLLLLNNRRLGKPVIPLGIKLSREERILIISGPNAGGKTVSMKTVGLLQLMTQAGLLIPAAPESEVGIFKNLFIHIGDTQSIEHELSTYSAHLRDMKYFMDFANGKTLFFIDELGSGSDPALGGAFAEAIVEELADRKSLGIITTHYLNLKVMAGKVKGILNGAMAFDEENLEPQYQLTVGKPGSSYTFAIAQRTGLPERVIKRARQLTDRGAVKLDKILHQTEQQTIRLGTKEEELDELMRINSRLKKEYEDLTNKERIKQQQETLKLQNKIKKEELEYLRDTERKFKQILHEWKKADDKTEVIKGAEAVLFRKRAVQANQQAAKKSDKTFETVGGQIVVGDLVRHKTTHQVGTVTEMRGDRGIVKIGKLPFNVVLSEYIVVRKKS